MVAGGLTGPKGSSHARWLAPAPGGFFIFIFFIFVFYKKYIFGLEIYRNIPGHPAAGRPGPGRPAAGRQGLIYKKRR